MPEPSDLGIDETRAFLTERAHKKFGHIPTELIVAQVFAISVNADFPVRRAALEALERRMDNAKREGLHVVASPKGTPWGEYQVAKMAQQTSSRRRRESRPYTTELLRLSPLTMSCNCQDFLKGSLGLCKHTLAVLEYWYASPQRLGQLQRSRPQRFDPSQPRLCWDPVWPLFGEADRLRGLTWQGPHDGIATARSMQNGHLDSQTLAELDRRRDFLKQAIVDTSPNRRRAPHVAADAATRALLDDELATTEILITARRDAERARSALKGMKRQLYPYQTEGVTRFLTRGRLLLADDMGLGKTTQAIACCHTLFTAGLVKRGLIVTPAALKSQWHREWLETTAVPAFIVDGALDERKRIYQGAKQGFLIANYELLLRDFELLAPWSEQLTVLDEAQRIKNYATKTSVYVKALPAERRLVLTGTPMENRLDELASILDWVDDRALAPKWRLPAWYMSYTGDGLKSKSGARNLDNLRTRLKGCLVRRIRTEVLAQLPKRSDTRVPIVMTPEQSEEHDALSEPIMKLASIADRRPLRQEEFLRLMQLLTTQRMIANGLGQIRFDDLWPAIARRAPSPALLDSLFSPKLYEFRRLVQSLVLDQGRKIVVFSQWLRMLKLADWSVRDLLQPLGLRCLFFTGAESAKLRSQNLVEFHEDPRANVLFLSDAGGVGLNLQKAANACINIELPWNPAVLEQRIGRIYRLGQKSPIDVYNLVSESSIESRIASTIGKKQALFKGLFDGDSNEIRFEEGGGFVAEVRKLLDAEQPEAPELPPKTSILPEDGYDLEADTESSPDLAAEGLPDVSDSVSDAPITERSRVLIDSDGGPASVLNRLKIERDQAGGLSIHAPPEVAGTLAELLETMAKMLRAQASG